MPNPIDRGRGAAIAEAEASLTGEVAWTGTVRRLRSVSVATLLPMTRPPTHRLTARVPGSLVARVKRCAAGMDLPVDEFVRRCVEGRVNQIEASRHPRSRRRRRR